MKNYAIICEICGCTMRICVADAATRDDVVAEGQRIAKLHIDEERARNPLSHRPPAHSRPS